MFRSPECTRKSVCYKQVKIPIAFAIGIFGGPFDKLSETVGGGLVITESVAIKVLAAVSVVMSGEVSVLESGIIPVSRQASAYCISRLPAEIL